ncbi:MAG: DedA family protein [Muribaculaceae bacterium]|nr:DedA family protein [Muribaculaceae bacterium]
MFDAYAFFQWFVENASYLMVFVFMTIESSFIPFPSEVVVPPAAYIAVTTGSMNPWMVFGAATAGALCGALINYFLALWVGRPIVYAFARSRFGHACLIDTDKVERAEVYFDKHGAISTLIGRLVPVIRQLISIPAGLARMNMLTFCIFTTIGAAIWNAVLTILGVWLGHTVPLDTLFTKVEEYNTYLTYIGLGIGVLAILFIIWNAFKPRKK